MIFYGRLECLDCFKGELHVHSQLLCRVVLPVMSTGLPLWSWAITASCVLKTSYMGRKSMREELHLKARQLKAYYWQAKTPRRHRRVSLEAGL